MSEKCSKNEFRGNTVIISHFLLIGSPIGNCPSVILFIRLAVHDITYFKDFFNKNENECKCDPRYTTSKSSFLQCNYYQKRKLYALLLESLIGFGFGHLYSGNYTLFISKFLFFFFTCYFGLCLMIFVGAVNNSNVNAKTYIYTQRFLFITIPLMIIWYFFDIIFYAIGRYKDGKGEDLY